MSQTSSFATRNFIVSSPLLLGLYAVLPFSILVVLIDQLFLGEILLKKHLPIKPSDWAFWAIVFNFPHIVSSFITLADKEESTNHVHLSHFKRLLYLKIKS